MTQTTEFGLRFAKPFRWEGVFSDEPMTLEDDEDREWEMLHRAIERKPDG